MNHAVLWVPSTKEFIVFGGDDGSTVLLDGACFDPTTGKWTKMPSPSGEGLAWLPSPFHAVLRGDEAVFAVEAPWIDEFLLKFNTTTRAWTKVTVPALPEEYRGQTLLDASSLRNVGRTGAGRFREVGGWYVGGGYSSAWSGAAESRATMWSAGDRVFVWSGRTAGDPVVGGALFSDATATWTLLDITGAPAPRGRATAVWTGKAAVIWGGDRAGLAGGIYVPKP